jgi:hypothetical protein
MNFDVPPPTNPHLYHFTVIGEMLDTGLVRVWLTEATARELRQLLGSLDTDSVSATILRQAEAAALPGVNDDHSFRLLAQLLRRQMR